MFDKRKLWVMEEEDDVVSTSGQPKVFGCT